MIKDAKTEYARWVQKTAEIPAIFSELKAIEHDEAAINDRFWRDLEFGTGGLRGVMGAGTNRLNTLTVGKATQGVADFLNSQGSHPSVCIAYDTRHQSAEFAAHAASVLCQNGVRVFLYDSTHPTPMLSYQVRQKKADAGLVMTASHNPKEYNGYKVYGPDGGQITDEAAAAILACIQKVDPFDVRTMPLEQAKQKGLLTLMTAADDDAYYKQVAALSLRRDLLAEKAASLSILYTPLHGSGNVPVREILKRLGFQKVQVVAEQELPDGDFPTAPYPNPENADVFELAIEQAAQTKPDLIFATDPDCDRIGVLAYNTEKSGYEVLTGNQIGVLLCDYIIGTHTALGTMPVHPAMIKTIVTSDMGREIAQKNGVFMEETLTGFKYIGEKIGEWEETKAHSFLFGFEESYGYLAGDFVRDKDAVIAAALIAEMTLYHTSRGVSLFEAMEELYRQYGYFKENLLSVTLPGQEGAEKLLRIMATLRASYAEILDGHALCFVEDYKTSTRRDVRSGEDFALTLPVSNVLKFIFDDGSWLVFRPSGTEPKIKVYCSAKKADKKECLERLQSLEERAHRILKMDV